MAGFDPTQPFEVISSPVSTRVGEFGWQQGPGSDPEDNGRFAYGGSSLNNPEDYAALRPGSNVPPGYQFPVTNPRTGTTVWATHRDKGPARWTGRGLDLAPITMNKLGANTDDTVVIDPAKAVPAFDPSQPFEVGGQAAPKFDPSKPHDVVSSPADANAGPGVLPTEQQEIAKARTGMGLAEKPSLADQVKQWIPDTLSPEEEVAATKNPELQQFVKGLDVTSIPRDVLENLTPLPGAYHQLHQAYDVLRGVPVEQAIPESQQFVGIEQKPLEERIKTGLNTAIQLAFAKEIGKQVIPQAEAPGITPGRTMADIEAAARTEPGGPAATAPTAATPGAVRPSAPYTPYSPKWFERAEPVPGTIAEDVSRALKPEPVTTGDVTRAILDKRKALVAEAQQLGGEANISRQIGQQVHPAVEQRIAEINQELNQPETTPGIADLIKQQEVRTQPNGGTEPTLAEKITQAPEPAAAPEAAAAPQPITAELPTEAVTGIANEVVAAERVKRGLPERQEPDVHSWTQAMKEAEGRDAEGPSLVEELKKDPRPLKDVEDALLLREQIKAQTAHDAAVSAVNENAGDASAQAQLDAARNRVQDVYNVDDAVGTEAGRGFNARKMLAAQDFTLAKMEATVRAEANKGKPLSEKQATKIKGIHDRIQAADGKLAGHEAERLLFQEARKAAPSTTKPVFLENAYKNARARIEARRGKLFSGYDPTAIADEAIIGAYHVGRGLTKFADWSRVMVQELGERIRPYIQDLWKQAQSLHSQSEKALADARAKRLATEIARITKGTKEYQARTAAKDISPLRPKREQLIDKEKTRLLYEREGAKKEYQDMLARERFKAAPWYRKAGHYASELAVGVPRSIKSAFDLSAVFRQGGLLFSGHPIKGAMDIAPMMKALVSEEAQFAVMNEIKGRANYPSYKTSKLELTEPGTALSSREEVFRSQLAEKVPGVAASERAYTTYLNRIRADTFDGMKGLLEKATRRKVTPGEERLIANYINVASGRGNMGRFAPAANALAKVFWSPRLAVSRLQYLTGQPLWHNLGGGGLAVRALIATEYARTLAGIGTMVAIAKMSGATVEADPRSGNFGIRFGNTRVDLTAGLKSYINYFSRIATNSIKTQKGQVSKLGEHYGSPTAGSLTWNLARGKLAPGHASAFNVLEGKQPTGQPTTALNEALGFYTPLSPQDVGDALQAEGIPQKIVLPLLAIGGMSTQTYEPSSAAQEKAKLAQMQARDKALLHGDVKKAWELTKFR